MCRALLCVISLRPLFALFICLSHLLLHPPDLSLHLLCARAHHAGGRAEAGDVEVPTNIAAASSRHVTFAGTGGRIASAILVPEDPGDPDVLCVPILKRVSHWGRARSDSGHANSGASRVEFVVGGTPRRSARRIAVRDNNRVLELSTKFSEGGKRMVQVTGSMCPRADGRHRELEDHWRVVAQYGLGGQRVGEGTNRSVQLATSHTAIARVASRCLFR